MRRVRATIVAVEKQLSATYLFCVCVCSPTHPPCKANVPYCHLWPVRPYKIFFTLSDKRHDFRKSDFIKNVFRFSLQLSSELFLSLNRKEQNTITNVYWSPPGKVPFNLRDFNET
jgi:hypothetical protein